VARNRKRAKERRARRPQPVAGRPRDPSRPRDRATGAPSPLEHAAPDAEIARQAELPPDLTEPELEELEAEAEEDEEPLEVQDEDEAYDAHGSTRRRGGLAAEGGDGAGEVAVSTGPVGQPRAIPGSRLINFLQGSWRELQRVQWPDRQQVIQATGVVIGFVIVAGVFLGVSDWVAGKLVNFIVNGHF
jgi:preprotein translocase SecE subunit